MDNTSSGSSSCSKDLQPREKLFLERGRETDRQNERQREIPNIKLEPEAQNSYEINDLPYLQGRWISTGKNTIWHEEKNRKNLLKDEYMTISKASSRTSSDVTKLSSRNLVLHVCIYLSIYLSIFLPSFALSRRTSPSYGSSSLYHYYYKTKRQ